MDPNSPINQQQSVSPQQVITSQPLTQSGLPPQVNLTAPSPKNSSKIGLILGVFILLLVLAAIGFYVYTVMSVGKSIQQASIVVSPKPDSGSPVPATGSADLVATNSADMTIWKKYSNKSFLIFYPPDWQIVAQDTTDKSVSFLSADYNDNGHQVGNPTAGYSLSLADQTGNLSSDPNDPFGIGTPISQTKTVWLGQPALLSVTKNEANELHLTATINGKNYHLRMVSVSDTERKKNEEVFFKVANSLIPAE